MRIRKLSALLGACIVLGGCVVLYLMMDFTQFPHDFKENKWVHYDNKLKHTVAVVHETRENNERHSIETSVQKLSDDTHVSDQNIDQLSVSNVTCGLRMAVVPSTDIQMLDIYKILKFDNPDGGAWKQGWNIQYSQKQWDERHKLKVFVVPHSHNDPGWIKTFEDYYQSQTRSILNNMVKKLLEDHRRKFIWAEVSFFSLWWDEIKAEKKDQVKKLLEDGQLEIVTGGWVMNDEANTHYSAVLEQIIEGHSWLKTHLDYIPRNSWAIDPFGHTPTMAYLLKRMGLKNLIIQRVHYSVKKHLAQNKSLEFQWRQLWDGTGTTDLFTHMMPFYSYDVPHTCGPDPKVCCQFDFRRLPGYGISCPWKIPPQVITDYNVEHRAAMLLDQYRKKAQLYGTNVVLAPLGDDFRYDHISEWDAQFNNYQRLFDYMNQQHDFYVEAQFGTLKDYFDAVHAERHSENFPVLSGDFFTYADRDDHYWSGYYTSRPFYKKMDRTLINYLRSAEILFGLAWSSKRDLENSKWLLASESGLTKLLSDARRSLSLFQHHDGITGTAKDHVVEDYAKKMLEAIKGLQHIMQQAAHFLLSNSLQGVYQPDTEAVYFDLDDHRKQHHSLPERKILNSDGGDEPKRVVLFNSLTWKRQELITLRVGSPYIKVTKASGQPIPSQVSPVFLRQGAMVNSLYEVAFVATLPPLSLTTYFVHFASSQQQSESNKLSKVQLLNFVGDLPVSEGFEDVEKYNEGKEFSISNSVFKAYFSKHGFVKAMTFKDNDKIVTLPVHIDFARYQARGTKETSGAYLFLPSGPADTVLVESPVVRVLDGPLFAQVDVTWPSVHHTVKVYKIPGADSLGLEIQNLVDISDHNNYELAMRVTSKISNGDVFYTDLNGLQIVKRKRFSKLHLQGNYYPLPTAGFIEDEELRLTILSAQPTGFGSLREGQMEVMQDRRLSQDDNRGLGQGVMDNHPTLSICRLLLEKRTRNCQDVHENHPAGLLTRNAHLASLSLLNPVMRLLPGTGVKNLLPHYTPVPQPLAHDLHLVKLHTQIGSDSSEAGMIWHRLLADTCFPVNHMNYTSNSGLFNFNAVFPFNFGDTVIPASLSFVHTGKSVPKTTTHSLCPMEMAAFILGR